MKGEPERLLRTCQLRRRRERDVDLRELDAERASLLHTLRREPLARHGARRHAVAVRPGQRVPCEEERLHRSEEERAVVEHVLHPDRLVEPNRRIVVGADEQADGRNALQEKPAEIREPARSVPAPAS